MREFIGTKLGALLLGASLWTIQSPVCAQSFEVKSAALKNGMKVLVQEDHTIPQVALFIFYSIGSRNEHTGTTGLSHFFEHMMFNGARKHGFGEFDRIMEGAGGSNNAQTNQDFTVYHETFPPETLETIFDLEADRIENLSFDPKVIASERGVVASERRTSVDNSNFGILWEQLWAAAFTAHPYHWPVVGWMSDIESWKMQDLQNHFKMGYSPSNATMVVVGDVTQDKVMELARKYIEPIPAHAPPPPVTTKEPPQLGPHRVLVRKFAQVPMLMVAYHIPQSTNPDYYALKLLDAVLFHGESSRMYTRLVDKDQLALSIQGDVPLSLDPSLYVIISRLKEGTDLSTAEKAIFDEIERVKSAGITDNELEKAKNILLVDFYDEMETQAGRARAIGNYQTILGDYRKVFDAASAYQAVKKEDIQRIAKQYFVENNSTIATLVPDKSAGPESKGKGGQDHE